MLSWNRDGVCAGQNIPTDFFVGEEQNTIVLMRLSERTCVSVG